MPADTDLYPLTDIRAIEQSALAAVPSGTLMQRAGAAACRLVRQYYPEVNDVLVLAGPGNNGGDALELAFCLDREGVAVTVLLFAEPAKQSLDAHQALQRARSGKVKFADTDNWQAVLAAHASLAIDGLFGIGLTRPIAGIPRELIVALNARRLPVLALDIPSGLDADSGNVVGDQGVAVRAAQTITFIGNKPGLHTGQGRDYAGTVEVAALDIDAALFPSAAAELNRIGLFAGNLQPRAQNSHKGSFGDVSIAGGAHGMAGAAILSARAAAHCGAGRVFIAFLDNPISYDSLQPELMCREAARHDFSKGAIVAGPGLGTASDALSLLQRTIPLDSPLVLDADALNLIAAHAALQAALARRRHPAILTPHPLEAARLLGATAQIVQADRLTAARRIAERFHAIVILKGSGTVIARPDGHVAINTTGNPALATAGTGDVLAGICGALLAQGWETWQAALAAPWLHGQAADMLVQQGIGPVGMTAGELIPGVRQTLNRLIAENARGCVRQADSV
jgi:hydroxyethylthiazole kinase-like uncharacterized protein yjeF